MYKTNINNSGFKRASLGVISTKVAQKWYCQNLKAFVLDPNNTGANAYQHSMLPKRFKAF